MQRDTILTGTSRANRLLQSLKSSTGLLSLREVWSGCGSIRSIDGVSVRTMELLIAAAHQRVFCIVRDSRLYS